VVQIIRRKISNLKLNAKINLYYSIILLIFCFVFFMFFATTVKYNREYNEIIKSATIASSFSIDFKKDFDYKMYRIIIGSSDFYEEDPYSDIENAQEIAEKLQASSWSKGNVERAQAIQKYLANLTKHVRKIEENIKEVGHYDENITILYNDIHVVTSLIQDTILEYIYYETMEMENVRAEMEVEMLKNMEFMIIMVIIMILGGLFISIFISNSISKPVKELSHITNQVAKGDLTVRSHIKNGAEVKMLSDSLNIMIEKLSNLIETVKIEQSNLRETEIKLLQEQINPHFLYNTLDTIIWLAETGKQDYVVQVVGSLSRYFRTSLSKGKDLVTLKDEELHVCSYLQIQKVRYGDILEYEIDLPKELSLCRIPKITLQPLVENALYHGIKNKRSKGKISLIGRKENNNIIIKVIDNGLGMTQERLKQVIESLHRRSEYNKDFYGLFNVNERIRMIFGADYGLSIKSTYGEGTEVTVCIPAVTADD